MARYCGWRAATLLCCGRPSDSQDWTPRCVYVYVYGLVHVFVYVSVLQIVLLVRRPYGTILWVACSDTALLWASIGFTRLDSSVCVCVCIWVCACVCVRIGVADRAFSSQTLWHDTVGGVQRHCSAVGVHRIHKTGLLGVCMCMYMGLCM